MVPRAPYFCALRRVSSNFERAYNGLQLAHSLAKRDGEEVRIFLLADAVSCALAGQQTPDGYYNLERMLAAAIHRGAQVGLCGTCMDARAIHEDQLVQGARRSTSRNSPTGRSGPTRSLRSEQERNARRARAVPSHYVTSGGAGYTVHTQEHRYAESAARIHSSAGCPLTPPSVG